MQYDEPFYVAHIMRNEIRPLFGELLKLLCKRAGITQEKLRDDAVAYRQYLIERGHLQEDDETGSMNQSQISRVMNAAQPPTYAQVYIWLTVIRRVYESAKYEQVCIEIGSYKYTFPKDLETDMYRLASFGTPDEIVAAYERCKPLAEDLKRKPRKEQHSDSIPDGINQVNQRIQQYRVAEEQL